LHVDFTSLAVQAPETYRSAGRAREKRYSCRRTNQCIIKGYLDLPTHSTNVSAGAIVIRPLKDQFYGEHSGTVRDPIGHEWLLGRHVETVTPEEMQRRYSEMFEK